MPGMIVSFGRKRMPCGPHPRHRMPPRRSDERDWGGQAFFDQISVCSEISSASSTSMPR